MIVIEHMLVSVQHFQPVLSTNMNYRGRFQAQWSAIEFPSLADHLSFFAPSRQVWKSRIVTNRILTLTSRATARVTLLFSFTTVVECYLYYPTQDHFTWSVYVRICFLKIIGNTTSHMMFSNSSLITWCKALYSQLSKATKWPRNLHNANVNHRSEMYPFKYLRIVV